MQINLNKLALGCFAFRTLSLGEGRVRRLFGFSFSCLVLLGLLLSFHNLRAQSCVNADFSDGNFSGWSGTYSLNQCSETASNGSCKCSVTNPYNTVGFNQGPNNDPVNDATNEYSQIITTAGGGNDVNLTGYGYNMPLVWPGAAYSARIGNMWQDVGDTKTGDGESISYTFRLPLPTAISHITMRWFCTTAITLKANRLISTST
jgi:hypothetical protein